MSTSSALAQSIRRAPSLRLSNPPLLSRLFLYRHHHSSPAPSYRQRHSTVVSNTHQRLIRPSSTSAHRFNSSTTTTAPQESAEMSEPTGLIATSGIEVLTLNTPNGFKASILISELQALYPSTFPKVTYQTINIMKNTQKQPWFTAINPNGRIPAIVDHDRGGFAVFEGTAILNYLTKHYDPENKLSFSYESDEYEVAQQWMAWQHGGLGPMQGQANHFLRFTKEKIPYGIQRYVGETERLYGILDARLGDGREYIAGEGPKGRYSIADIATVGWANIALLSGLDLEGQFPNVAAWLERCLAREGTKKGFTIPAESGFVNAALKKKIEEDPETKKQTEEIQKLLSDAKAQYGYKYSSP